MCYTYEAYAGGLDDVLHLMSADLVKVEERVAKQVGREGLREAGQDNKGNALLLRGQNTVIRSIRGHSRVYVIQSDTVNRIYRF